MIGFSKKTMKKTIVKNRVVEKWSRIVKRVGVIWFDFSVVQFLLIVFTQQDACQVSKYVMEHMQKSNWELDLPWFSCG